MGNTYGYCNREGGKEGLRPQRMFICGEGGHGVVGVEKADGVRWFNSAPSKGAAKKKNCNKLKSN